MSTTRIIYKKIGSNITINNSVEIQSIIDPNNDAAIQLFQDKFQNPHLPEDIQNFFKQQIQKLESGFVIKSKDMKHSL